MAVDLTFFEPWSGGNQLASPGPAPGLVGFPTGRAGAGYFNTPGKASLPTLGGVVRGKIIQSFGALNLYDVATDGKSRVLAIYMGGNSGGGSDPLGTQQVAAFHAGTEVWLVLCPDNAGVEALILGAASRPIRSYLPQRLVLGYPQVAGLDLKLESSGPDVYSGKHTVSRQMLRSKRGLLKDVNSAAADLVDGDWVVLNYYGGGIGVEAFKTWLGSGPMNSLIVYPEDELTRLTGTQYQFSTMSEDYEDMRVGRTMRSIRRKVYYPSDALLNNLPQVIEVDGPSYTGSHKFTTYRSKDNPLAVSDGGPTTENTSRSALIHEYRGIDGTFVLTAASSLTLQKWVGVKSPIEIAPAPATASIDQFPNASATFTAQPKIPVNFPAPDARLGERALETDLQQVEVLSDAYTYATVAYPPVGGILDTGKLGNQSSLYATVYAGNRVLSTLGFQAARAFRTYTGLWQFGAVPRYLQRRGDSAPTTDPTDWPDPSNYDIGMWKRLPKSVVINLNSYGMAKRIFLGRALITITDEGGIVLQDASGSQIVMSGGNIYLTAEHDIIKNAGRNCVTLAGQDAATMAYRNVEAWADGGHVAIGASMSVSVVGGNGGQGNVSIESRSVGTGADDGVFIRSNSRITALGQNVDVKATTGSLSLSSSTPIFFRTGTSYVASYGALCSDGVYFGTQDSTKPSAYVSVYGAFVPSLVATAHVHGGSFSQVTPGTNVGLSRLAYSKMAAAADLQLFRQDYEVGTAVDRFGPMYGPTFLASYGYSVPAKVAGDEPEDPPFVKPENTFALPEAEWQRRIDKQDADLPGAVSFRASAVWRINTLRTDPAAMRKATTVSLDTLYLPGTIPYPGYDLWKRYGYVQQITANRVNLSFVNTPLDVKAYTPVEDTDEAVAATAALNSLNITHRGI